MNLSKKVKLAIKKEIKINEIYDVLTCRGSFYKYSYENRKKLINDIEYDLSNSGLSDAYLYNGLKNNKKISQLTVNYSKKNGFITFNSKIEDDYELNHLCIKEFDEDSLCFYTIRLDYLKIFDKDLVELNYKEIKTNEKYFFTFKSYY